MADEKDIAEDAPTGGKKNKTKLVIIVGGALVVLMGSVGAALFLLGGAGGPGTGAAEGDPAEVVEEGDPQYHKLAPTFVVNLPPGGSAKMLQLSLEIMTYEPSVIETLNANDPMIRHHLINLLEEQQAARLMTLAGKEGLQQAIHDLLTEQLTALKEPGRIKGVFFTQFVMQ